MMQRVTFDNNVLDHIVNSERKSGDGEAVRAALSDGRIRGFISEAVAAIDIFGREATVEMVGSGEVVTATRSTGPNQIQISVGSRWIRPALHPKAAERMQVAFALGVKMLIGPRHFVDLLPSQEFREYYEQYPSHDAFITGVDRTHKVDQSIMSRGLGRAKAIALGLAFSERAGKQGEWWPRGLGRASTKAERRKVHKAACEWADGDAIAAHVGYGNDLFCTEDFAGNAGQQSVLSISNRSWLRRMYSVDFITLVELATRLRREIGNNL